jgi:hypothetical protein
MLISNDGRCPSGISASVACAGFYRLLEYACRQVQGAHTLEKGVRPALICFELMMIT